MARDKPCGLMKGFSQIYGRKKRRRQSRLRKRSKFLDWLIEERHKSRDIVIEKSRRRIIN